MALLTKCFDCPVSASFDCFHQNLTIAGSAMDGTYLDDDAYKEAVPCTDRRTGASYDLELWRVQNQAHISSGGSEFPTATVPGDGIDPELGDPGWSGPYE